MTDQRNPGPTPDPRDDDDRDDDRPDWDRSPNERPPFERDPEAQRAPGPGESDTDVHRPPMQASGAVGGVMGPPHQAMGQGPGG